MNHKFICGDEAKEALKESPVDFSEAASLFETRVFLVDNNCVRGFQFYDPQNKMFDHNNKNGWSDWVELWFKVKRARQ